MASESAVVEEVTIRELVNAILVRKWLIVAAALLGMILAMAAAWIMPSRYRASVLVAPVSETGAGSGGLGSIISQVGGLASLAGLSADAGTRKAEAVAVLQSEELTARYLVEENLLPVLFADRWDDSRKEWKTGWRIGKPTIWEATRLFGRKVRSVSEDSKSGLLTISVVWTDPKLAAAWANDLVRITNLTMRDKAISEAARNIEYLKSEAAKTSVVQLQSAIYSILEAEIRKEMLARGSEEYAFRVIDPAVVPEKPAYPSVILWAIFGLVVGGGFASLFALVRVGWLRA